MRAAESAYGLAMHVAKLCIGNTIPTLLRSVCGSTGHVREAVWYVKGARMVLERYFSPALAEQGSAHGGRQWLAPTTSKPVVTRFATLPTTYNYSYFIVVHAHYCMPRLCPRGVNCAID